MEVRKQIALKLKDPGGVPKVEPAKGTKKSQETEEGEGSKVSDNLKWDHPIRILGRPVKDPLLHICEVCSLPILIYGRMKKCRHAFCHGCAKKASGVCPKCKEGDQTFEEASMGSVFICTHTGGRYDNKGCGRSYLSQRDLDAHTLYRHKEKSAMQQPVTHGNPLPFPIPPFFQAATSSTGVPVPGMPPRPGLPPPLPLPPGMVLPGIPHQGLPGLAMVPGAQFPANLAAGGAPPPPPPPAPWAPPTNFKQS